MHLPPKVDNLSTIDKMIRPNVPIITWRYTLPGPESHLHFLTTCGSFRGFLVRREDWVCACVRGGREGRGGQGGEALG